MIIAAWVHGGKQSTHALPLDIYLYGLTRGLVQVPMPKITWRREDGRVIFRDPEKRNQVGLAALFHGEHLELQVHNISTIFLSQAMGEID
jgi:hypothetical protein